MYDDTDGEHRAVLCWLFSGLDVFTCTGVLSILDAATNDLASLINRLDLEATPNSTRGSSRRLGASTASPIGRFEAETPSKKLRVRAGTAVVAKANQYVHDFGKMPFVIYQGQWSILQRSFERDIIPVVRDDDLALAPWDVLALGRIGTDAKEAARTASSEKGRTLISPHWERTEGERRTCAAFERVLEAYLIEFVGPSKRCITKTKHNSETQQT